MNNNEQGILRGNLSVNDNKNRRRIKSVLPGDYASTNSAQSSTPLENEARDANNLGAPRSRAGERNSAYEAIQAKIKAAGEASKKARQTDDDEDNEDPFANKPSEEDTQATSQN